MRGSYTAIAVATMLNIATPEARTQTMHSLPRTLAGGSSAPALWLPSCTTCCYSRLFYSPPYCRPHVLALACSTSLSCSHLRSALCLRLLAEALVRLA